MASGVWLVWPVQAFRQFTDAVVHLKFDEEPKYDMLAALFEPLIGSGPQRSVIISAVAQAKVSVSRDHSRPTRSQRAEMTSSSPFR